MGGLIGRGLSRLSPVVGMFISQGIRSSPGRPCTRSTWWVFTVWCGPTVWALVVGNALLAAIGAGSWTYVLGAIVRDEDHSRRRGWLIAAAVYSAFFLAYNKQYPLADNLKYALLPWLLLATWKPVALLPRRV